MSATTETIRAWSEKAELKSARARIGGRAFAPRAPQSEVCDVIVLKDYLLPSTPRTTLSTATSPLLSLRPFQTQLSTLTPPSPLTRFASSRLAKLQAGARLWSLKSQAAAATAYIAATPPSRSKSANTAASSHTDLRLLEPNPARFESCK